MRRFMRVPHRGLHAHRRMHRRRARSIPVVTGPILRLADVEPVDPALPAKLTAALAAIEAEEPGHTEPEPSFFVDYVEDET